MNRREKNELKAQLGQFVSFGNGRFKDEEVECLASIVDRRNEYDGVSRTYRTSYKTYDSEDTYHVTESDTYTFHSDDSGIHIDRVFVRDWDDGQHDTEHDSFDTARGILNMIGKVIKK